MSRFDNDKDDYFCDYQKQQENCIGCKYNYAGNCNFDFYSYQIIADERERIVKELEELAKQTDYPECRGDIEVDLLIRLSEAIEIVRGGENE